MRRAAEDRAARLAPGQAGDLVYLSEAEADPNAFTPDEVRRLGLRDVRVICPSRLVEDGRVLAGTGEVVEWSVAVRHGLVEA